jgi:hypothetical protein
MSGISLIVRGDDFGLSHTGNQSIAEAFDAGVLTCASLLVTGPWVAEAARLARANPEWEIGLQLNLSCNTAGCRWGPVSRDVPGLVEPTGTFPAALALSARPEEIGRELQAQLDRARAWDVVPAYLEYDGEPGAEVEAVVRRLSEQHGIPARMNTWGIEPLTLARGAEPMAVLTACGPGVYLWVTRPAPESPETWALWPDSVEARERSLDAALLCDGGLRKLFEDRRVELLSFRQHIETRLGSEADKE